MPTATHPLQALLLTIAGWSNRHQQQVIEYLVVENRVLREQLGDRPLCLTDDQRRRLAAKGKILGRRMLERVVTIVTPDLFMGRAAEGSLRWLAGKRFLICGRDTRFSRRSRIVLETAGISLVRTPFQAPNANAHAERFVRSIKEEWLDRMILFGEDHLRHVIGQHLAHYHVERDHQGIGNELIEGPVGASAGEDACDERLGGLLKYYRRAA